MPARHLTIAFLILLAAAAAAFGRADFRIGDVTAAPGSKATGFVDVPRGADEGTRIPVSVLHGPAEGPVLVVTAGMHGSEYAPILAAQNLASRIDARQLRGTLVIVHVANPPSFFGRTVYYGTDGKNLNRSFPGRADGTVTERIARVITTEIFRRGDILIDLHSGDNNESLRPYVVYYESPAADPAKTELGRRMARVFGIDLVKSTAIAELDVERAVYGTRAAFASGLAVLAVEAGQLGRPDPAAVRLLEDGVVNVARELGLLAGRPRPTPAPTRILRDQTVRATTTGLFRPLVERGRRVRRGQILGYVTDFFGARLETPRAPFDGIVMYFTATPPVTAGEPLVNIGETGAETAAKPNALRKKQ